MIAGPIITALLTVWMSPQLSIGTVANAVSSQRKGGMETDTRVEEGRANLPHAFGRRFRTLDEYLLHLQQHAGPIDLPWWRQVAPDRFERVTSVRSVSAKREVVTRAELMQRFGFTR